MADDYKRPGWYPDPDGAQGERWWNGSGWSDSRRGGATAAATPPVPLVPVARPAAVSGADIPVPPRPNPYAAAPPPASARPAFTIAAPQNRSALVALVTGVVALFGFSVLGPVAIIFGILGIAKARQLRAEGAPTGSTLALASIGLITGAIATVILIVTVVAFIAAFSVDYSS